MSLSTISIANLDLLRSIDFSKKESFDTHFPLENGCGHYRPPWKYFAVSKDLCECFDRIRAWRKLSPKEQKDTAEAHKNLSKEELKKLKANFEALKRMKEEAIKMVMEDSNEGNEDDSSDGEVSANLNSEGNENLILSVDDLLQDSGVTRNRHRHVGLFSSEASRKREFDEIERLRNQQKEEKKRKVGERPTSIKQQTDKYSMKARNQCMRSHAKFNDTATYTSDESFIPKHTIVTLIYNEVGRVSCDGGPMSKCDLRLKKPTLICLANSKQDCSKVMKAFTGCIYICVSP